MKSLLSLLGLTLLLAACTTTTSDATIRRVVVGVWSLESDPAKTLAIMSDGQVLVKRSGVETARSSWQVKDGYVIAGIGSSKVESNKVLKISSEKMVVLSIDGHTQLTFNRL